jgi:predicted TIM-barrel fold metal-dependent hydrolase
MSVHDPRLPPPGPAPEQNARVGRSPVPPLLRRVASDEYTALPWTRADRRALARLAPTLDDAARAARVDPGTYAYDRRATAATRRAVDDAAGGGYYPIPPEAERDPVAAEVAFGGHEPVVDVQTHLVRPSRMHGAHAAALEGFLRMTDPERWPDAVDPERLDAAQWAAAVLGASETAVAVLTSTPGGDHAGVLTNPDIGAARDLVDRYAGTGRVRTHAIVHPNVDGDVDRMLGWHETLRPDGWKAYTLWAPPGDPAGGWFLDDEVGNEFLEQVRTLGAKPVAVHKGIAGPIPGSEPATASPRDVGPAARAFPALTFHVYHSGYEPDPRGEEGPSAERAPTRGVDRLVASLRDAGIGPGANVYAELGSTWFLVARKPREAAHVLGKLLLAVGPERILWGTDCVWYGSPQPLVDAFRAFTIPQWMQEQHGYPALTPAVKARVLGTNAAAVYGVDLDAARRWPGERMEWLDEARPLLAQVLA